MIPQDIVKQHIANGRPAHAYCLLGPSGTTDQKEIFIQEIATLLSTPFQSVSFFGGEGVFSIDDIRRMRPLASLAARTHPHMIVLRNADALTQEAANALLKTLEEPASSTIFFLLASSRAALPSTILSRVWTVRFIEGRDARPKPGFEYREILKERKATSAAEEKPGLGRAARQQLNFFQQPLPARYAICEKLAKQDDHGKQFVADLIAELRKHVYEEIKNKNAADILPHAVEAYELLHYPGAPYRLILDTLASYEPGSSLSPHS
ncbi:MAG: hypothetical protein AAB604_03285 [Patescibacteria group bacterium]|mgnify:CR=1 FL=1